MPAKKAKPDPPRAKNQPVKATKKPTPKKPLTPAKKVPGKSTPKPTPKAKPKPPATPRPVRASTSLPTSTAAAGEAHRQRESERARNASASVREIGEIPDIEDVDRREKCRSSLRHFCETYNPEPFHFSWSADHLRAITRIEEGANLGALFALAMARGSGKTVICRMAALWVMSYAIRRYSFVIGATDDKAIESLDTLRTLIRFLPLYIKDFPEISHPARKLAGIANRATGQTCGGESTLIEWAADRIVLPTVPPPTNWPKTWPLRSDGKVPTSGVLVSASGLTGEGIRGSLKTLTTGEMVRPDFVLLDDPQTPESARSRTQNVTRMKLVSADVLGMAGPGKAIAAVMPCTVIEPGDMVDDILDRSKHPLWRGERTGMLRSLPTNLALWDSYFEQYSRCAQLEPPDFTESNAYYLEHQEELEAGSEASWRDRKEPNEVSAIQSAMHLYFRDRRGFMAEYMNQPMKSGPESTNALDPDQVIERATNLAAGIVPRECTRLTAMIDVGAHLLWFTIVAWDERFGGSVIGYGPYPDQSRSYFSGSDPRPSLSDVAGPGKSQDAAIYAGLTELADRILGKGFRQEETGAELRVERCLVDANWGPGTDLVYDFCRRSKAHSGVLVPSHGKFIGASSNPMSGWPLRPGERRDKSGPGWRLSAVSTGRGRHVTFDTNAFKTFVCDRLRTPRGAGGCLLLHAPAHGGHQLFADHVTAEYPVTTMRQAGGRMVDEWRNRPNCDNHLWDCLVGCAVGASMQGVAWSPSGNNQAKTAKARKKTDVEELYRKARGIPVGQPLV